MLDYKIILTDIEGTTSAIDFVHKILFPYSNAELINFIHKNIQNKEVQEIIKATTEKEIITEAITEQAITTLKQWISEDKKIKPLKDLQGLIWEQGYKEGIFHGHIYDDAYQILESWHRNSIPIYIYSSGSIKAQKLLFAHTKFGDLNYLFTGNFDTSIGGKKDPDSYRKICNEINIKADKILFLSDNIDELNAASEASLGCVLVNRSRQAIESRFITIVDFCELN